MTARTLFPLATGRRRQSAFTLVELMVTLTIMAILMAVTLPGLIGTSRAYHLSAAGQSVTDQLTLARQAALSSSHLVQVRFYRLPDYDQPNTASRTVYRAMQCFTESDPNASGQPTLTPLTKPVFLPAPVAILSSDGGNVSPILSSSPTPATSSDAILGSYGTSYDYIAFHFRPDGSTDLTAGSSALTLGAETDKAVANGLPANYRTLLIDPAIGTVRTFRP